MRTEWGGQVTGTNNSVKMRFILRKTRRPPEICGTMSSILPILTSFPLKICSFSLLSTNIYLHFLHLHRPFSFSFFLFLKSKRFSCTFSCKHKTKVFIIVFLTIYFLWNHGLFNYIDIKAKCRHPNKLTCKGTLRQYTYQSL